jgi:hypothetical protein
VGVGGVSPEKQKICIKAAANVLRKIYATFRLNGKMIEKVSAKGKIAKYKIWHFAMHITRKLPSPKLP